MLGNPDVQYDGGTGESKAPSDDQGCAANPADPGSSPTITASPSVSIPGDALRCLGVLTTALATDDRAAALRAIDALRALLTGGGAVTPAPRRCARCGEEVPALLDVAVAAQRARHALDTMRLAVPDDLTRGARQMASALACYAQLCPPTVPQERP
jgi:hypothetical protein